MMESFANRLNHARLIIGRHDGDECNVRSEERAVYVKVNDSIGIDWHNVDPITAPCEPLRHI